MRSLRGGNEIKLSSVPVQTYGFKYGGTESENAAKMLLDSSDKQNEMNNTLSGGRRRGMRIKRGGSSIIGGQKDIEIPQFTISGPKVSANDANTSSLQLNSLLVKATNDASNDDMIGQTGGKRRKTIRRRNKAHCSKRKQNKKGGSSCKYRKSIKHKKTKNRKYHR